MFNQCYSACMPPLTLLSLSLMAFCTPCHDLSIKVNREGTTNVWLTIRQFWCWYHQHGMASSSVHRIWSCKTFTLIPSQGANLAQIRIAATCSHQVLHCDCYSQCSITNDIVQRLLFFSSFFITFNVAIAKHELLHALILMQAPFGEAVFPIYFAWAVGNAGLTWVNMVHACTQPPYFKLLASDSIAPVCVDAPNILTTM